MNNYTLISDIVNLSVEDRTTADTIVNRLIFCGASAPYTNENYVVRKKDEPSEEIKSVINRTYIVSNDAYNFTDSDIGKTVFFDIHYTRHIEDAKSFNLRGFYDIISCFVTEDIASKIAYNLISANISVPLFKVGDKVLIVPPAEDNIQPYIETVVNIMGREYVTSSYRFSDDNLMRGEVELVCGCPSELEIEIANMKKKPNFALEKVNSDKIVAKLLGMYSLNSILHYLNIVQETREFDDDKIKIIMERTPQEDLYSLIIK